MPDRMSGLIWVQTVCKSYQQTALLGRELNKSLNAFHFKGLCTCNKNLKKKSFSCLQVIACIVAMFVKYDDRLYMSKS